MRFYLFSCLDHLHAIFLRRKKTRQINLMHENLKRTTAIIQTAKWMALWFGKKFHTKKQRVESTQNHTWIKANWIHNLPIEIFHIFFPSLSLYLWRQDTVFYICIGCSTVKLQSQCVAFSIKSKFLSIESTFWNEPTAKPTCVRKKCAWYQMISNKS